MATPQAPVTTNMPVRLTFDEITATPGVFNLGPAAIDTLSEKLGEIVEGIVDPIYQNDMWSVLPEDPRFSKFETRGTNMGMETHAEIERYVQELIAAGDWHTIRQLALDVDEYEPDEEGDEDGE